MIYYIYQYSITFYPAIIAIIASVPGFTALQILQPCSRSDGRAEPAQYFIYLYYIMHNTTAILYAVDYAILINHKKIKNISKKGLTIVTTYVIIESQQRQSNNASPLHFNCSIEKRKTNFRRSKVMTKTLLTIGLNDKDTERQEITTGEAKNTIAKILLNQYNIFAFTMFECSGVYKMESTGNIVFENSIRVEIATDDELTAADAIIATLKTELNQESIMMEKETKEIFFK